MTEQEVDAEIARLEREIQVDKEIKDLESKFNNGDLGKPSENQILNAPADLSGRTMMKAFGTDIGSKIKYYQEKNKDKDVMENPYNPGEIIARKKGTTQWLKEDPSGWQGWKEFGQDILDIPVDVSQGLLSGAAAGLGAAAAPFTPHAGAALGGTIGYYGTEALRQGVGSALFGQKPEIPSFGQVATTGILEGGASKIFGPGMSKQQFTQIAEQSPEIAKKALTRAEKYFIPEGKQPTAAEAERAGEYLAESSKGILSKVGDNILPLFFGGSKEQLKTAKKPVSGRTLIDLTNIEKNPDALSLDPSKTYSQREIVQAATQQGKLDILGKTSLKNITDAVDIAKNKLKGRYESSYAQIKDKFNVNQFKQPILDRLKQIKNDPSSASIKEEEILTNTLNELFTPKPITITETKMVKQEIPGYLDLAGNPLVKEVPTQVQRQVPGSTLWDVNSIKNLSTRLKERGDIAASYAKVENKDVTTRKDRGALLEAANLIDFAVKQKLPDKNLPRDYAKHKQITDSIMKNFGTEEKAAASISNAMNDSAKQKKILSDLKTFDKMNGTNLVELAQLAQTSKRFGDPSLEQIGGPGITSTSRTLRAEGILGAIGNLFGKYFLPDGGQVAGQAAGRAIGGLSSTNAVLNKILSAQEKLGKGPVGSAYENIVNMNPYARQMMLQPWLKMTNEGGDK